MNFFVKNSPAERSSGTDPRDGSPQAKRAKPDVGVPWLSPTFLHFDKWLIGLLHHLMQRAFLVLVVICVHHRKSFRFF